MKVILLALGFMIVFEGVFPLIAPGLWQQSLEKISHINPETVRRAAMVMVIAGLGWIWVLTAFV